MKTTDKVEKTYGENLAKKLLALKDSDMFSAVYAGERGECFAAFLYLGGDKETWHRCTTWPPLLIATVRGVKQAGKSEYDDFQAGRFLTSNGIKFRATLSDTKTPAWSDNGKHGHHYRVTLSRKHELRECPACGPMINWTCPKCVRPTYSARKPARLTFDFWSSIADAEKGIQTVRPYSVLACISGDAYTPETFADFCGEYGYEQDSIKALQTFRRCSAFAKRLRAFFTEAELEQLQEIN